MYRIIQETANVISILLVTCSLNIPLFAIRKGILFHDHCQNDNLIAFASLGMIALIVAHGYMYFTKTLRRNTPIPIQHDNITRKRKGRHFAQMDMGFMNSFKPNAKSKLFQLRELECSSRYWPMELSDGSFDVRANHKSLNLALRADGVIEKELKSVKDTIENAAEDFLRFILGNEIWIIDIQSLDINSKLISIDLNGSVVKFILHCKEISSSSRDGCAFILYQEDFPQPHPWLGIIALVEASDKTRIVVLSQQPCEGNIIAPLERTNQAIKLMSLFIYLATKDKFMLFSKVKHRNGRDNDMVLSYLLIAVLTTGIVTWLSIKNKAN